MGSDKRKVSIYMPDWMLVGIKHHALRLDRSPSWIIQHLWKNAKHHIEAMPDDPLYRIEQSNKGG